MENQVIINDSKYEIESVGQSNDLTKAVSFFEQYYELCQEYERIKAAYDLVNLRLTKEFGKGFEEYGLKSISNQYQTITYIPPTEGRVETETFEELNIEKLKEDLDLLGLDLKDYMETKTKEKVIGKRKGYIRRTNGNC